MTTKTKKTKNIKHEHATDKKKDSNMTSASETAPTSTITSQGLTPQEEAEFLALANQLAALNGPTTTSSSSSGATGEQQDDNSSSSNNNYNNSSGGPPAHVLPLRQYLEASILPLLTRALEATALTKPNDPLEFLAAYLLSNNPMRQSPLPVPPCGALSGWLSGAASSRAPALADEGSI